MALDKEDIEFNEYLTLFSLPSTSEPRKPKTVVDKGGRLLFIAVDHRRHLYVLQLKIRFRCSRESAMCRLLKKVWNWKR